MRVGGGEVKLSQVNIDSDLDMSGTYQVKNLASPATGEALRKGSAEITMAEIATAILNATNGLAKLDASADVPTAQIPYINASKINAGRFGIARLQWTDDAFLQGAGSTISPEEIDKNHLASVRDLTPAIFQTNAGTGDATNPDRINDTAVDANATWTGLNQYIEIDFGENCSFYQYRCFNSASNDGDGRNKIQYKHLETDVWTDWITDIPIGNTDAWSSWVTGAIIVARYVRIICTTLDTTGYNRQAEYELKRW